MNLLHANDRRGEYPASWYAATARSLAPFPMLKGAAQADVVVVGGGYTGLSAALHLAERGFDVALLEAHRVGFGASGRNGGQLGSGQRLDQMALEQMLGEQTARRLWHLGEEAKGLVRGLIDAHGIDSALKPGVAWAGFKPAETDWMARYGAHMQAQYGYSAIEPLDRAAMQALCPSPAPRCDLGIAPVQVVHCRILVEGEMGDVCVFGDHRVLPNESQPPAPLFCRKSPAWRLSQAGVRAAVHRAGSVPHAPVRRLRAHHAQSEAGVSPHQLRCLAPQTHGFAQVGCALGSPLEEAPHDNPAGRLC